MRFLSLALAAASFLTACGWGGGGFPPLSRNAAAAGSIDPSSNVVYITDAKGTFCGGLLLSASTLVTAEHCFDSRQDPVRAITAQQNSLQVGRVLARGSQRLRTEAPSAQDLAAAQVAVDFPISTPLPRLGRPLLQGEIVQAWIPARSVNGQVRLSVQPCPVLGQAGGVVELDCHSQPGASGSPVFAEELGQTVLAGFLVARGQDANAGIAVAAHAHLLWPLLP